MAEGAAGLALDRAGVVHVAVAALDATWLASSASTVFVAATSGPIVRAETETELRPRITLTVYDA